MGEGNMMKIAIIDDNINDQNIIEAKLKEYFKEKIDKLKQPDELIDHYYDLIFLDVMIDDQESFDFGKRYLAKYPNAILVYISSFDHFVYPSYCQNTFFFIRKSQLDKDFENFILKYRQLNQKEAINIIYQNHEVKIPVKEIIYIESRRNQIFIVSDKHTYTTYKSLNQIIKLLNQDYFYRFNNHLIINLNYIQEIAREHLIMANDIKLEYTRGSKQRLLKEYQIYRSRYL